MFLIRAAENQDEYIYLFFCNNVVIIGKAWVASAAAKEWY